MLDNDDDAADGYLPCEAFADFLAARFENPQLVAPQKQLLSLLADHVASSQHDGRNKLLLATDAEHWQLPLSARCASLCRRLPICARWHRPSCAPPISWRSSAAAKRPS